MESVEPPTTRGAAAEPVVEPAAEPPHLSAAAEPPQPGSSRKRALYRKDKKKAEVASGAWSRCMFFQERKKRYCSIPRAPGSEWCGHHTPEHQSARPRAPCPVDSSHTAFVDEMAVHAARCASAA